MFTGIVEGVARVVAVEARGAAIELRLELGARLAEGVRVGDSIAIDGCCLTATRREGLELCFEAVPETLARTSLSARKPGSRVNIERALRADARLDGHIVQGHVDAAGEVVALDRLGEDVRLRVRCPGEVARLLVHKGSVAVDGVSLTVIEPSEREFSVALIPHTLGVTTLGDRRIGDLVNIEVDVLGKYVQRYLERRLPGPSDASD
jgi:riboflavin synthase